MSKSLFDGQAIEAPEDETPSGAGGRSSLGELFVSRSNYGLDQALAAAALLPELAFAKTPDAKASEEKKGAFLLALAHLSAEDTRDIAEAMSDPDNVAGRVLCKLLDLSPTDGPSRNLKVGRPPSNLGFFANLAETLFIDRTKEKRQEDAASLLKRLGFRINSGQVAETARNFRRACRKASRAEK